MHYRKWSVPEDTAKKVDSACISLGYKKKTQRWKLLERLLEYSKIHSDLFRL